MADQLLGPTEVSDYLGVPVATLYQWRSHRTGPPAIRVGRHLRYRRSALERWLDQQSADTPQPAA